MYRVIDNSDCYWLDQVETTLGLTATPAVVNRCRFASEVEGAHCALNELCCRYVASDSLDEYIKMLLKEIGEN